MSDDALTAQIRDELARIVPIVSELTGLPSNWSGRVELVDDARFRGRKPFGCDIELRTSLARQDARWRTLIHETLHTVSVGFNRADFQANVGWEEGVVEQLQRLLRQDVLARLSIKVAETAFAPSEDMLRLNNYIDALERIRQTLAIADQKRYYIDLLSVAVRDRQRHCLRRGMRLASPERERFLGVFSACNRILMEGAKTDVNL